VVGVAALLVQVLFDFVFAPNRAEFSLLCAAHSQEWLSYWVA